MNKILVLYLTWRERNEREVFCNSSTNFNHLENNINVLEMIEYYLDKKVLHVNKFIFRLFRGFIQSISIYVFITYRLGLYVYCYLQKSCTIQQFLFPKPQLKRFNRISRHVLPEGFIAFEI